MTKEITLSISERVASIRILNEFKGALSGLAIILEDIKKFAVTDEEWKAANLTKTPTDAEIASLTDEQRKNLTQQWKWDDLDAQLKTIVVDQVTSDYILKSIEDKSKAGEITVADVAFISLDKKLK